MIQFAKIKESTKCSESGAFMLTLGAAIVSVLIAVNSGGDW